MRIRHQILSFIHEKIFRHDKGREPNKFTNMIYAILMPICYLSERNTMLRYDWNRDVFIIDRMEFSHDFLKMVHKQRSEQFVGHNFDHLNLLQPRPYGKQYNAFINCVAQIEAGQNTVFMGLKWMMISMDYYQKLTNTAKIERKSMDAFPYIKPKFHSLTAEMIKMQDDVNAHRKELEKIWPNGNWHEAQFGAPEEREKEKRILQNKKREEIKK